jgi:hypothetical protein
MSARLLAWYTTLALGIATLLASAITWAPGHEVAAVAVVAVLGAASLLFAGLAILLTTLPREHWCNQSGAVRIGLAVPALFVSLLFFLSV